MDFYKLKIWKNELIKWKAEKWKKKGKNFSNPYANLNSGEDNFPIKIVHFHLIKLFKIEKFSTSEQLWVHEQGFMLISNLEFYGTWLKTVMWFVYKSIREMTLWK